MMEFTNYYQAHVDHLQIFVFNFRSRVLINGKLRSYRIDNEDGSFTKRFYVYASKSLLYVYYRQVPGF